MLAAADPGGNSPVSRWHVRRIQSAERPDMRHVGQSISHIVTPTGLVSHTIPNKIHHILL